LIKYDVKNKINSTYCFYKFFLAHFLWRTKDWTY